MGEVLDTFGLCGGVVGLDAAKVGENVAFEEAAVRPRGWYV